MTEKKDFSRTIDHELMAWIKVPDRKTFLLPIERNEEFGIFGGCLHYERHKP